MSRGIQEAKGDFILIQDADFEYDPNDVPSLLEPLIQNAADVVYGSRFKKSSHQVHRTYHYLVNGFLTALSKLLSGIYLTDMETCYKLFRADLLKAMNLGSARFGIEVEITARLAKTRARILELPIRYYPRTRLQGKKINWRDGIAALHFLVKYNLFVSRSEACRDLPSRYQDQSQKVMGRSRSSEYLSGHLKDEQGLMTLADGHWTVIAPLLIQPKPNRVPEFGHDANRSEGVQHESTLPPARN